MTVYLLQVFMWVSNPKIRNYLKIETLCTHRNDYNDCSFVARDAV